MVGMASRLRDKVAIITGSGGSIGRAACLRFSAEGARIVGCDIHCSSAQATQELVLAQGGQMVTLSPCDLTTPGGAQQVFAAAIEHFDRVDILYNNAARAHFAWFQDMDYALFSRTIRDELDIIFHLSKAVWPFMVTQGSGVIVNTASVSGSISYAVVPGLAHSTAKAGVLGMTRHLAMEGAKHGIRVNSLSPGLIRTNQSQELMEDIHWCPPSAPMAQI